MSAVAEVVAPRFVPAIPPLSPLTPGGTIDFVMVKPRLSVCRDPAGSPVAYWIGSAAKAVLALGSG